LVAEFSWIRRAERLRHTCSHRYTYSGLLKFAVFWFVFRVIGRLPRPAITVIADIAAAVGYRVAKGARNNVHDNLRHVMPNAPSKTIDKAARQIFRNVAYYYAELAYLPRMDLQRFLKDSLVLHGVRERLVPTIQSGQGAIMLSGHYGNPELVLQAVIPLGIRGFAVVEPVQPPALARMLNEIRSSHGVTFVPVGIAGVKQLLRTIREGGAVALMGDRDIEGPRMRLPFFGRETWMPTGPVEVALRTGAPLFPSFSLRRGKYKIEAFLEEPLVIERTEDFQADVRALALRWIERYEEYLRREPHQWAVLERLWDDEPARPVTRPEREREKVS
jgi:lauroyl/myristoyl acyltransferase